MGYYIARDDQQLGPITPAQVAEGLSMGALRHTDLAWTDGMESWQPIAALFGPATPRTPAAPPPLPPEAMQPMEAARVPMPSTAPAMGGGFALPSAGGSGSSAAGRPGSSGQATASLILGVIGFVFMPAAIASVVYGNKALRTIKESNGDITGKGKAVAGLVMGYIVCTLALLGIIAAIALPNIGAVNIAARVEMSRRNLTSMMDQLKTHAKTHGDQYPASLAETPAVGKLAFETLLYFETPPKWTADKGFEYTGAGQKTTGAPDAPIFVSRSKGPHGEQVVAHNDGSITGGPFDAAP